MNLGRGRMAAASLRRRAQFHHRRTPEGPRELPCLPPRPVPPAARLPPLAPRLPAPRLDGAAAGSSATRQSNAMTLTFLIDRTYWAVLILSPLAYAVLNLETYKRTGKSYKIGRAHV